MADKPSRALVVYGDGLAPSITASHSNLHSLASIACCGFLSLPCAPPSEASPNGSLIQHLESEDERTIREFSLLLDSLEGYLQSKEVIVGAAPVPKLSERFPGIKAALLTTNPDLKSFAETFGLTILPQDELIKDDSVESLEMLKLLGFQEGKTSDTSQFDVVFVHIGTDDSVEKIDALVGNILQIAPLGSDISSRLHLSVVMSYGKALDSHLSVLRSIDEENSNLQKLFPRQSYTMRGYNNRDNVRHHSPMLVAQWQDGVTRKDMVQLFSFEDIKKRGGNLVIPVDRFLHEIAFKLWKAPKYGA